MKKIEISARSMSGIVGFVVCYSLSIYLFWEDQNRMVYFRVLPSESHFAHFLMGFMRNDTARTMATIIAFLSLHLSWSYRYLSGDLISKGLHKIKDLRVTKADPGQHVPSDWDVPASSPQPPQSDKIQLLEKPENNS